MTKYLILGDGKLGSEIKKQTNWDIISRKLNINFDINKIHLFSKFFDKYGVLINCIANTETYSKNKKDMLDVNVKFVSDLIKYCNFNNKKLIHFSTDYLYTYSNSNANENDVPVHCNTWYGYSKLIADSILELYSNTFLIIRMSHKKRPFEYKKAQVNILGNFDYTDIISSLCIKVIKTEQSGIINIGTDTKTIYELAKQTAKVKPKYSLIDKNMPTDVTMDLTKMKKLIGDLN